MLFASAERTFGSASLRSRFMLDRSFWAHAVERRGLTYDSRFVPVSTRRSQNVAIVVVTNGRLDLGPEPVRALAGPAGVVMSETHFEGCGSQRAWPFRSFGDPFEAIDLRVRAADLVFTADEPRVFEPSAALLSAVRALRPGEPNDATTRAATTARLEACVRDLFLAVEDARIVRPGFHAQLEQGGDRFSRVWGAFDGMLRRYYMLPTLEEVAAQSGLSLRQIARELKAFGAAHRWIDSGWRESTRRLRLKVAVLALSARDLSIGDAAKAAGYGSVEAMARAFRDAALPAPSVVRTQLVRPSAEVV